MRRWIVPLTLAMVVAVAVVTVPATAATAPTGVVYALDNYTPGYGAVVVHADGTGFTGTCVGDPTVSASPRRFVHSADAETRLTWSDTTCSSHTLYTAQDGEVVGAARWSPDGQHVAFDARWPEMQSDGTVVTRSGVRVGDVVDDGYGGLTLVNVRPAFVTSNAALYFNWSPDNHTIVFAITEAGRGDSDIWMGDVDTGTLTALLTSTDNDTYPTFSPDGGQIAFSRTWVLRGVGRADVFIMPTTGAPIVQVTKKGNATTSINSMASWSPDGNYIAFSGRDNSINMSVHVYRIDVAGLTKAVDLTPKTSAWFLVTGWRP